jgi:hypothetical protein
MAELVHEQVIHVRTPDGEAYVPRPYGERQPDGRPHAGWKMGWVVR